MLWGGELVAARRRAGRPGHQRGVRRDGRCLRRARAAPLRRPGPSGGPRRRGVRDRPGGRAVRRPGHARRAAALRVARRRRLVRVQSLQDAVDAAAGAHRLLRGGPRRPRGRDRALPRPTGSPTGRTGSPTPSRPGSRSASGTKTLTALAVMSLVERRDARARHDRPLAARRRPAAGRRRRDRRAPAGAPLGHRRLPRRGRRRLRHRLRDAGAGAPARDDRAVPPRAGRTRDGVARRRAVRLQQRRLRAARPAGRARERRGLPRAGPHRWSASPQAWSTRRSCAPTSSPGAPRPGYLAVDGLRTNVLHLPVLGSGDGGIYSTAADLSAFWDALLAGRIVSPETVAEMVRRTATGRRSPSATASASTSHATGDGVWLEGYDAGVSFLSLHQPSVGHHLHRHLELVRRRLADRHGCSTSGSAPDPPPRSRAAPRTVSRARASSGRRTAT